MEPLKQQIRGGKSQCRKGETMDEPKGDKNLDSARKFK
jgi:hypothetical protein